MPKTSDQLEVSHKMHSHCFLSFNIVIKKDAVILLYSISQKQTDSFRKWKTSYLNQ